MSDTIISAIISVVGSVLGSMALVNWRLQTLEKKVDEHNKWGEKFEAQVTDIAVIKNDISYIKKSIDRLAK